MAALSLPPPNSHAALEMPGGAPRFLSFPRSIKALAGSSAVLRCRISGDPPPCVLWERVGNIRLELGDRCMVQQDGDWYQLVITDLRLEDSGHYMCRASNWSGEGYAGAKLTVIPNVNEVPEPPAHGAFPPLAIRHGPSASIPCADPVASSKTDSFVPPSPDAPVCQQLSSDASYLLSSNARYSEIPDFPPHFLLVPNSQRLCRGQSAELSCRVSGKPEPTVRWEKDGRKLEEIYDGSHYRLSPEGHTLYISQAHSPDAGVYVCRASNSVGQCLAAAVLLVDPTLRQGQEPAPGDPPPQVKVFTVNEGKHAKLRCLVTGKPRPEIIWRKDGRAVSPGRRTLIYEDREGHFILKVLFCRQQDRGLYVCGASNTAGNTLSAVMLHVREVGEQFPAPLRDIAVREGQDAVLECSVPDGSRTSWFLEDQRLHPGKRHLMEEQGSIRRLIIRGARTDDDGVYLCQTQRGAQSIAEVAVRGSIVKRLPRRLEVAEGGNAAFCAETDSDVEQVGWTRHGEILSEDHRTVLKSFGRTHVLVLVGVTQEDSGIIQFHAGLSESTCQLRVKARGVSVSPACGEPPSRTLDAGQPLALNCHVPSSGTKARWMKDGQELESGGHVSIKSDGRMRRLLISSSDPSDCGTYTCHAADDSVSFSVTVTEPPVKIINTSDDTERTCVRGESVALSCEVSRESAQVRWYRDGVEVEESENVRLEAEGRHRRLVIRAAQAQDSGEFVCDTGDDSVFYRVNVTEPPVKIVNRSEDTEPRSESGERVALSCEVSREDAQVRWYKDGAEVAESENVKLESDGRRRRLVILAARTQDAGEYVCHAGEDSVSYNVTVTEPPVKIVNTSDDVDHKCWSGERVALSCEVSREKALVRWYRDGVEVQESENVCLESEGTLRRLVIHTATPQDSGEFVCDTGDDSVFYNVIVREPPAKIVNANDDAELECLRGERVVLNCELSRANARVLWYKDGEEVEESENIVLESEGKHRRLIIPSAQAQDSGEYVCDTGDDSVFYDVRVTEPPVKIVNTSDDAEQKSVSGERVVLSCEVSRESAQVRWYKDGVEVEESENVCLVSEGRLRQLVIRTAQAQDSGEFVCDAGDDSVFYNVTVTEPPVKIQNTSDDAEPRCVSGERVVLSCEVSRGSAQVRWYRDGVEVEESENIRLESEGTLRRLIIDAATPGNSGEFVCDAGDDSVVYNVTVTEPPVKITNTSNDTEERCLTGEKVTLSCEVSRESAAVRWYKDGERVDESDRIKLESEGRLRRLVILSAECDDSGEFVCDAGDDSIFYYVSVKEPPVKIVNTEDDPEHQSLSGERVVLTCEVSKEDAQVRWYKDGVEVEESEDLILESDGRFHRLIITSAQVQDSGEFVCDAGSDSLFYSVTVTEPPVKILSAGYDTEPKCVSGERVALSCEVSRESAQVRWYRDGVEVEESENIRLESEGTLRRLIIEAAQVEDSGEFECVAGDDSLMYCLAVTEPPVKFVNTRDDTELSFVTGDRVVLGCEVSRENAAVRWYRDGVEVKDGDGARLESEGPHRRLIIPGAQTRDSSEFVCDAGDDAVFFSVIVTEPPTKILFPEDRSQELEFTAGDRVVLCVEVSRRDGTVRWFKDGLEVDDSLQVTSDGCRRCLILANADVDDSGEYICDADDDSVTFDIKVSEPPVAIVPSGCSPSVLRVTEGDPLCIECELSRSPAAIKWLRNGKEVTPGDNVTLDGVGTKRALRLESAREEDAGRYECNVGTDSRVFTVHVDEPPVVIVGNTGTPEHHALMTGDDLVLSCELSRPNFKVRWLRDGEELLSGGRVKIVARGVHRQLTIHSLRPTDSGTYTCDAGTDQMQTTVHVEVPRQVEFITELENITVLEGETATYKCVVSPDDVDLLWELNGSSVYSESLLDRVRLSSNGLCHSLTLHSCRISDSGIITANAEGKISRARLRVQEAQVLFTEGLQDTEVEEEQDVTLQVKVTTEKAEVHWVKQGVVIQSGSKYTLRTAGQVHSLTIHCVEPADRGRYSCESLHDRSDGRLNVLPKSIAVKKGLKDAKCMEGSNVEFCVELSHEGLVGEWWKGGVRLTSDDRCEITAKGRQHILRFFNLALPDSGVIAFTTDVLRTTAQLTVTEHPLAITQPPQDFVVNESGSASFQCEVSKLEAVVTWSKDGEQLTPTAEHRVYSVGRRRILQLSNCRLQDAGTYACHVGDISASATLRVLEQEPVMVKDLQDVDIVENENAVFTCEASCAQAKGEWFKNGERVKVTTTTKIRQEGRKHFLLICGAQCEDSGEIVFRARRAESRAQLRVAELPVRIVKALRDRTALEGHRVVLECKVSPPRAQVTWLKGSREIAPSSKYQICTEDAFRKLIISNVGPEDEDLYSVKTSGGQSSARLLVEGLAIQLLRRLSDVKVKAPANACFECEVSVPLSRAPQWSLNGRPLSAGPDVILENRGTRYKLTLRGTHPGMTGTVGFTAGRAHSEAKLAVQE
ncbi:obscurin-like protein 1 [Spea bombifrons]|uniref:obscurin-like protein 1 n=1 Tax=Spea bombifrons TaxID=233779 RepID=UPI00234A43AC|nr:obscurin-like protein 1 [Spea bombifrons]XP_053326872.1 obscurin-like protein 1 [Spea bombifrons]